MNQHLLISIIIPTYNRAHLIEETLDSILRQDYKNWECLVIDDGSTDGTEGVMRTYIEKDSRFKYFSRPNHMPKGPCSCRNLGFEKSCGDYVNFFDSDDILLPMALTNYLRVLDSSYDAIICKTEQVNFKTGKVLGVNCITSDKLLQDYFCFNVTFYVCGPLWKRSFLEKQEVLFDEHITYADDWDFNLRMLYQSPKLYFLNEVLIHYRWHENSYSKELRKLNKEEIMSDFRARDKHLQLVKGRADVDFMEIKSFIIKRYKRYFKWAMNKDQGLTWFLIHKIIKQELSFGWYGSAVKSFLGFIVYRISGRGYVFFKD